MKSDSSHSGGSEAMLVYGPNGFRVMRPGHWVACAVTAEAIPLEELRYWSVDRQEAYATPEIAARRLLADG